jgi:ssDNA-binding Zn-finger/Zn-ribbon topoisomerase 1
MVERINRQDATEYWGCSRFPACRGTRPLAFADGAEAQSRDAEGRPLTPGELERVTKRYPEG